MARKLGVEHSAQQEEAEYAVDYVEDEDGNRLQGTPEEKGAAQIASLFRMAAGQGIVTSDLVGLDVNDVAKALHQRFHLAGWDTAEGDSDFEIYRIIEDCDCDPGDHEEAELRYRS